MKDIRSTGCGGVDNIRGCARQNRLIDLRSSGFFSSTKSLQTGQLDLLFQGQKPSRTVCVQTKRDKNLNVCPSGVGEARLSTAHSYIRACKKNTHTLKMDSDGVSSGCQSQSMWFG